MANGETLLRIKKKAIEFFKKRRKQRHGTDPADRLENNSRFKSFKIARKRKQKRKTLIRKKD